MGFGGSVSAMIASLKNNSRRKTRDAFEGWDTKVDSQSEGIPIENITEEELQEIRDRLQKEQQLLFKKQMFVYAILVALITIGVLFIIKEPITMVRFFSKLGI